MSNAILESKKYKRSEDFKTLLFWRGPFSQWWYSPFEIDGETFNCAEQYMMVYKARLFGDVRTEMQIMRSVDAKNDENWYKWPKEYKKLGRQVSNFDAAQWAVVARHVVYKANWAKFIQNPDLFMALLYVPSNYTIVEASPMDAIWGIKMPDTDPDAFNPANWQGKNWLGQVLTDIRRQINYCVKLGPMAMALIETDAAMKKQT